VSVGERVSGWAARSRRALAEARRWVDENQDRLDLVARFQELGEPGPSLDDPWQVGWRIGKSVEPRGDDLWCRHDQTCGVIGPMGSGKTLDILLPRLLGHPGAAMMTLTNKEDMLLAWEARAKVGPVAVCDPFGVAPGMDELVWDPIPGCEDATTAEKRAAAFAAGTIKGSSMDDSAARFYATECTQLLQCYFHAAALAGKTMDDLMGWVANPRASNEPGEILLNHPNAAPRWYPMLRAKLADGGDDRTSGNTITTTHQAMKMFMQPDILRRCVPGPGRPATDIRSMIAGNGTFFLLGREDAYASASPYLTALTEHILDVAVAMADVSEHGRLCPPFAAVLDELPSTAPLPTLPDHMSQDRKVGVSIVWAAQTRAQLDRLFKKEGAVELLGITNVQVIFGGSNNVEYNKEVSDLLGTVRVSRESYQTQMERGSQISGDDIMVIRPEEVRQIKRGHVLIVAGNLKGILARTYRAIDGEPGRALLDSQRRLREQVRARDAERSQRRLAGWGSAARV
jgi:type IV secretion system protein VirD4